MLSLLTDWRIKRAIRCLKQGGVIAYPTEAVFGLGCDPFNEQAVERLLSIKKRSRQKGLILIAAQWQQVQTLVSNLSVETFEKITATWPGSITWVLPASDKTPPWIRGDHSTLAIRVTAHPLANQLCAQFGKPLVSTSANFSDNTLIARTTNEVNQLFGPQLDYLLPGKVGNLSKPTEIRNALTGEILRR